MTLGLDDTALLRDALRAPHGMQVTVAVGTTFTVDLTALLAIPVAASFPGEASDAEEPADLLETIRRHSERTILFCQAGAISVPTQYRAALTFVERTVIEVAKPVGGIFHPKWWALRFDGGGRTLHRVLIMSRNLTFDRAFDVIARFDEDPASEHALDTRALTDALGTYTTRAARRPEQRQLELIDDLRSSLSRARLAVPAPFTAGSLVLGHPGGAQHPFHTKCDDALAVSPFLTSDAARAFAKTAARTSIIVSRRASLDGIATALVDVDRVLRVKDAVLNAQESADSGLTAGDNVNGPGPDGDASAAMRGLHAKFYVQDLGETSTMWLGSANLTAGGFGRNHEMLVRLDGRSTDVGIATVLDPAGKRRDLSMLVEPHDLPDAADAEGASDEDDGVSELDSIAYDLASRSITITASNQGAKWSLDLSIDPFDVPDLELAARPLTLSADFRPVTEGTAVWSGLDLTAITPWVVLKLSRASMRRTVLARAELVGDPPERRSAIIAHAIHTRDDFLRYLAATLGIPFGGAFTAAPDAGQRLDGGWRAGPRDEQILEDLLTTASRAPRRLDTLDATLRQLDARSETRAIVPEEFRNLWQAVDAAIGPK